MRYEATENHEGDGYVVVDNEANGAGDQYVVAGPFVTMTTASIQRDKMNDAAEQMEAAASVCRRR